MNVVVLPQKRGRKPSETCLMLRTLAAGPVGASIHVAHDPRDVMFPRLSAARAAARATMAAGPGWYSIRYAPGGNRITKIGEPANPPKHFTGQGASGVSSPVRLGL